MPAGIVDTGLLCREVQDLEEQWSAKICGEPGLWESLEACYEVVKQRVQL